MKSILEDAALTLATAFPAFAEVCGRWGPCSVDDRLTVEETRGYVYGNRGAVEPWIKVENKRGPAIQVRRPAPQPDDGTLRAATPEDLAAIQVVIAEIQPAKNQVLEYTAIVR